MIIRASVADDRRAVIELLKNSGLPVDDVDGKERIDFLVACRECRDDAQLLGVVGLERLGDIGLLRSLAVPPHARCTGVGADLVTAIEAHAMELGIDELWLLTNDTEAFFGRLGFEVATRDDAPPGVRHTRQFSELCPGTAVLMRRELQADDTD